MRTFYLDSFAVGTRTVWLGLWLTALLSLGGGGTAKADTVSLTAAKGPGAGQITLSWTGPGAPFSVYRGISPPTVATPPNLLGTTGSSPWIDSPPADMLDCYLVMPSPAAICGNGVRESGEDCDDGNVTELDGCTSTCRFEQIHRANYFKMQFGTSAFCPANRLGSAFASVVQGQLQTSIDNSVSDGSFSLLLASIGPHDLSGTNDPGFQLGVLTSSPLNPAGSPPYNGASDLDWWYAPAPASIDGSRHPLYTLNATIAAAVLNAGPGTIVLPPLVGPGSVRLSNTRLTMMTNASSAPTISSGSTPPGHLASENLDPALTSYASASQTTTTGSGQLCGNVAAVSLAQTPIPASILTNCTQYTASNSMLDLIVGGCTVIIVQVIIPKQPDTDDPTVPPVGAGPPYTLTENASHVVTTCRDHTSVVVNLTDCLNDAAYSSFFRLATGRVIAK
jgi:cysteine-rich repeat protein